MGSAHLFGVGVAIGIAHFDGDLGWSSCYVALAHGRVKIAKQEVADKIDTQDVTTKFPNLENIWITFLCIPDDQEEEEKADEKGRRQFNICLPYEGVQ